jgi:hypothetical protein
MRCSCAFLSECWGKFAFAVRPLVSGPGEPATPEPLNSGILTASILPKRCHRPLSFGASSPLIRGRLGGRKFLRLLNFRSMILAVSYQTARSNPLAGLILFRARGENDPSSNRVRSVSVCRCNCGRRVHSHSCVDCSRRSARTQSTLKTHEVSAPLLLVAGRNGFLPLSPFCVRFEGRVEAWARASKVNAEMLAAKLVILRRVVAKQATHLWFQGLQFREIHGPSSRKTAVNRVLLMGKLGCYSF